MKHLVLGSSGQIGSHLVRILRLNGEDVIEFDIVNSSDEDLRISNNQLLEVAISKSDFVHFLAFDVGGAKYMAKYQHTYDFINNNSLIMSNTFAALKKHNKPFIFASSQMSNMLHSAYGILKSIGESYTNALGGVVIKFWNVYGHETDPEKTHVITDFIKKAKLNKRIEMMTDGQEERQFLYGDDAAECLLILSRRYNEIDRNQFLHITNFQWSKIIEIAEIISSELGSCDIMPASTKDNVQKGYRNEPDKYILNFWKPKHDLREGIKKTISLLNL